MEPSARQFWTIVEPLHAVTYFAPDALAELEAVGYRGFWRGYFAGRSAPLGHTGPAVVSAVFYGFAPRMVARALPSVWDLAPPPVALQARRSGAGKALAATFAAHDVVAPAEAMDRIAELLRRVVRTVDGSGRPLGAANATLDWPDEPVQAVWHACTVLRETRGDGHVAALLTAGLSGLETLVLRSHLDLDRLMLQPARGWTDEEWYSASDQLRDRGLLEGTQVTARGTLLLQEVETVTDRLAEQPWTCLSPDERAHLARLLAPLSAAAATWLPKRNPIGLPSNS